MAIGPVLKCSSLDAKLTNNRIFKGTNLFTFKMGITIVE